MAILPHSNYTLGKPNCVIAKRAVVNFTRAHDLRSPMIAFGSTKVLLVQFLNCNYLSSKRRFLCNNRLCAVQITFLRPIRAPWRKQAEQLSTRGSETNSRITGQVPSAYKDCPLGSVDAKSEFLGKPIASQTFRSPSLAISRTYTNTAINPWVEIRRRQQTSTRYDPFKVADDRLLSSKHA